VRRQKLNALIKQAIAGDSSALEQLCQLYAKTILFQARLLVRNKDDAEDVAQKVAITMLRDIRQLRSPYAFRSWLQRLIVNASNKQNARSQREAERRENLSSVEAVIDESPEAQPGKTIETQDLQQFVGGYLEKLPAAQAVALTLYYYEQLSYKEVADVMGVSVGSVSSTISKAKQNLKKMLKDRSIRDVMGIIFIAPFLRGDIGRTIAEEVESRVSEHAVERLMVVCKSHIAGFASNVAAPAAATGVWGTIVAVAAALTLLGGLGIGALMIGDEPIPVRPPDEQKSVIILEPDSRVTYSIAADQGEDNPVNPLTVKFRILSNERLDGWRLLDAAGLERLSGREDIGVIDAEADAAAAAASGIPVGEDVEGDFIDIASLNLEDGAYTLIWSLFNEADEKAQAYWHFSIETVE
jgi:RNA polymerase sigma-70 factor (ECF subfamily)